VYSVEAAEPIVRAVSVAIMSDMAEAERGIKNAPEMEKMGEIIARLAVHGGCRLGQDQIALASMVGMKRLDGVCV